jgi:hypothetical protein
MWVSKGKRRFHPKTGIIPENGSWYNKNYCCDHTPYSEYASLFVHAYKFSQSVQKRSIKTS